MQKWNTIPTQDIIEKTIQALQVNGIQAMVVENGKEAKEKVLEILPQGAEVMNMASVTIDTIGLSETIMESGKYTSVKKELMGMDRTTQAPQMQKLGAAPEYSVGSVHAVTEDGHVFVASNTGSQLPAYAYGAQHVIWVVGAQKIVTNNDDALKRIYDYVLPLESERLNKAYNMTGGSFVSKILIFNREIVKDRITLILVKESLGF